MNFKLLFKLIMDLSNILLDDLKLTVAIIDSAAQKGCFRAGDLQLIGTLNNKLIDIINANNTNDAESPNEE